MLRPTWWKFGVVVYGVVCGDMAWLGLVRTPPPFPLGSPGGSDKTWFPDQGQIDSWVPEEEWWAWDWDWEEGPLFWRLPEGHQGPTKHVGHNDTDCLIREKSLLWWWFIGKLDIWKESGDSEPGVYKWDIIRLFMLGLVESGCDGFGCLDGAGLVCAGLGYGFSLACSNWFMPVNEQ